MNARTADPSSSLASDRLGPAAQEAGPPNFATTAVLEAPQAPGALPGNSQNNQPTSRRPGPKSPAAARALATAPGTTLVAQVKLGNAEALEILLRRHWRRFCRYAQRLCGEPDAAQDVCQAACFQAVMHLSNLRADGAFCVWVEGLIANEARRSKEKLKKVGTPIEELDL